MPADQITLPVGEHKLAHRLAHFRVELHAPGPLVRIVGEVPHLSGEPSRALAIQLDPQTAIELAAKISDVARSMGWPLPSELSKSLG